MVFTKNILELSVSLWFLTGIVVALSDSLKAIFNPFLKYVTYAISGF